MNSIPVSPPHAVPIAPKLLTPLQKKVVNKLREATDKIVKDVISVLIASKSMSVDAFIDTYVSKKTNSLSHLDRRTQLFAQRLLAVVDEDLNKTPNLSQSFDVLASYVKDSAIRQKLITATALSSIKKLVLDFDTIKPSIIDDINAYYESRNPSWKIKLLTLTKIKWPSIHIKRPPYAFTWQKTATVAACAIIILTYCYWPTKSLGSSSPYQAKSDLGKILIDFFAKASELKAFENPYCQSNACDKYTSDKSMKIPYDTTTLFTDFQELLNIIDRLTDLRCRFRLLNNISFAYNVMDIGLKSRITSDCEITI